MRNAHDVPIQAPWSSAWQSMLVVANDPRDASEEKRQT
jgi:hypothetical protein